MKTQSRNEDGSPVKNGPERITRRSQGPAAGSTLIIDREMASWMATIRERNIRNVSPLALKPAPSSCTEVVSTDVLVNDKDDAFLINLEDIRTTFNEMQHIIESFSRIFKGATLELHIRGMVETKVVNLPETAKKKAGMGEKTLFYQAMKKLYAELSLEAPPMRSYTWTVRASPTCKNSSNTSRQIWSKLRHLLCLSRTRSSNMHEFPSLTRPRVLTKVGLAWNEKRKPSDRR